MADIAHTVERPNRSAAPSPDLAGHRGSQDGVKQSTARRGVIASRAVPAVSTTHEYCEGDAVADGPVCMYRPPPKFGRAEMAPELQTEMGKWLRSHGKTVKVSLTNAQKQQMRECFHMMDVNNSGGIDARELGSAFQMLDTQQVLEHVEHCLMYPKEHMLGIQASEREVQEVCASAGHNGELNYLDFVGVMTDMLGEMGQHRLPSVSNPSIPGSAALLAAARAETNTASSLPFDVTATAYRRKVLIQALRDREHGAEIIRKITGKFTEYYKVESDASGMEKPATPETVLEQVVSGLNDDDMAAIEEALKPDGPYYLPTWQGPRAHHKTLMAQQSAMSAAQLWQGLQSPAGSLAPSETPDLRQALAGGTTRSSLASKHSSPRSSLAPLEATQAAAALRPQVSLVTALAADKSAASGSKLDAYLDSLGLEPKMAAGLQSTTRSRLGPSPQPGQSAAQLLPRSSSVAGQRFSTGSESSSVASQRFSSGSGAPLPPLQHGRAASRLSYAGHQQPVTGGTAPHWSESSAAAALLDTPPVQRVQYRITPHSTKTAQKQAF